MSKTSDVPSVMDSFIEKDRFEFIESNDRFNVEVWKITKNSTYQEIFGTDKTKFPTLMIPRKQIDEICQSLIESGTKLGWRIFLLKERGQYKVLWACVSPEGKLEVEIHNLSEKTSFFSSRGYLLVVPRLA